MEILKYYKNSQIKIILEIGIDYKNQIYNFTRELKYDIDESKRLDKDYKEYLLRIVDNILNEIKTEAAESKMNTIDKVIDLICLKFKSIRENTYKELTLIIYEV